MKNIYLIIFCILSHSFAWAADDFFDSQTLGHVRLDVTKKDGFVKGDVYWVETPDSEKKLISSLEMDGSEAPFSNFSLIDIENDGAPEIESTGACGQVCVHEIYKVLKDKIQLVFKGEYSRVHWDSGYYIFEGGSGCCAQEISAFYGGVNMSSKPDFVVGIYRGEKKINA